MKYLVPVSYPERITEILFIKVMICSLNVVDLIGLGIFFYLQIYTIMITDILRFYSAILNVITICKD